MSTIFTIGHSNRPLDAVLALLRGSGVDLVIDVRRFPRSRANPQFNDDRLPAALAAGGIGYRHLPDLGGRRRPSADSANGLWREDGFRGYADYALTPAFTAALAQVEALAAQQRPALMCAEAVWWQCHRRIIADYLVARGHTVLHILGPGQVEPAQLTAGAKPGPHGLLYPPRQATLPL